jgi:thiamine biosynthesis lipoprotein
MKTKHFLLIAILGLAACSQEPESSLKTYLGNVQGTTFNIRYISEDNINLDRKVDSVFKAIDASMSTYLPTSTISKWNKGNQPMKIDEGFLDVLLASFELAKATNGLFDPTVGPLVQAWGFGKKSPDEMDSMLVKKILADVGYEKVLLFGDTTIGKINPNIQLDFNAIAQGYTVDQLAVLLSKNGIRNFMIEVGGELICRGINPDGKVWRIGIDKPSPQIQEERFQAIIQLSNKALATSGNYRKFRTDPKTGIKYSHTINPKTGYPVNHQLLSVSVVGPNCMMADAYATSFMVMGLKSALEMLKTLKGWDAYFVFINAEGEWETYATNGFEKYIL